MSSAPFGLAFAKLESEVCQIFIPSKCIYSMRSVNPEKILNVEDQVFNEREINLSKSYWKTLFLTVLWHMIVL